MSESDLLDALSEGFSCSAATTVQSAPITTSKVRYLKALDLQLFKLSNLDFVNFFNNEF